MLLTTSVAALLLGAMPARTSTDYTAISMITSTANALSQAPAVSGDGTRIAFRTSATNLDSGSDPCIVVYDSSGPSFRLCSNGLISVGRPSISRDGRYVAFYGTTSAFANVKPYVFDLDSVSTTPTAAPVSYALLYNSGIFDFGFPPQVSDSNEGTYYCVFPELAVEDGPGTPTKQIIRWTIGSMTLVKVSKDTGGTDSNGDCFDPVITADGTQIAYTSTGTNLINGDGNKRIFRTTLSGGVWSTNDDVFDGSAGDCTYPTISADGNRVSYLAGDEAWVWDEGLGTSFNVSPGGDKRRPFMSADGLVIAYESPDLMAGMMMSNQLDSYLLMGSPVTLGNDGPYLYVQLVDDDNSIFTEAYHFNSIVHLRSAEFAGLSADGSSLVFDSANDRILNGSSFPSFNEIYLRTGASW